MNKILTRLQHVQNKAAHIVRSAIRHAPSSDLLHSLHWLYVRKRIEFKTASVCFKAVKLGTPLYLKSMLQVRSSSMHMLTVPRMVTSVGLRHSSFARQRIWNGLRSTTQVAIV